MKNLTTYALVIAAGALLAGAGVYFFLTSSSQTLAPNLSPRSGDAIGSAEFLNAQHAVEYYRSVIQNNPNDPKPHVELAQLYIQEARITALHHEYFPRAEELLKRALDLDPSNFNALITRASMYATLHRFEEAVPLAERALRINPYSAFAYGVLMDTQVEMGEYDAAVETCDKMLAIRPDLRSYARASYMRELHGDLSGAIAAMHMAADAGVTGHENRAWALYNLGKLYFSAGKPDTASFIFKGILDERPSYAYAMAGLATIHASKKEYAEAIRLLEEAYRVTADHIFMEELAELYGVNKQASRASETIEFVLREFEDHQAEGWNIDKEYAMFCANHNINLNEALDRAAREYRRRPENIEALDVYAWTLFKNGRVAEAIPYTEKALRLGTLNAGMRFRAGLIHEAAGNRRKALELVQQALGESLFINVLYADEAQRALQRLTQMAAN